MLQITKNLESEYSNYLNIVIEATKLFGLSNISNIKKFRPLLQMLGVVCWAHPKAV